MDRPDCRDVSVQGLLEATDRGIRLRSKDPVDRKSLTWVTRQVAELEFLLHPADRISGTALADRDDQRAPGVGANDAVNGDAVPSRTKEVLQRADRMPLVALADQWPWAKRTWHNCALPEDYHAGGTGGAAPIHHPLGAQPGQ